MVKRIVEETKEEKEFRLTRDKFEFDWNDCLGRGKLDTSKIKLLHMRLMQLIDEDYLTSS